MAAPFLVVREGVETEHIPSALCQRPVGKGAMLSPRLTKWGWDFQGSPDPVFLLQEKCMARSTPSHLPSQRGVTPFC